MVFPVDADREVIDVIKVAKMAITPLRAVNGFMVFLPRGFMWLNFMTVAGCKLSVRLKISEMGWR